MIGEMKMLYTLPELKKELKKMYSVKKVNIWLEEYGEGFNVYSGVEFLDSHLNRDNEFFDLSEEEKKSKAEARAKRVTEALTKAGYEVEYEGVANC